MRRPSLPLRTLPLGKLLAPVLPVGLAAVLVVGLTQSSPARHDDGRDGARGADVRLTAAAPARGGNPVTPGNFTGYGFDQCLAPTQKAMNRWLTHSPFLSVGIYISGYSRACRDQPNLTPSWISTQLRNGWRLLPITLGPQASCADRFPRYGNDATIDPSPGAKGKYGQARQMGRKEAGTTVADAKRLGIVPGSTLWYDLEAFDITDRDCRESALAFLSAWTTRLHQLDYVSGVYSSAGSGIKMLDDARVNRPKAFALPDMIWLARWDGVANTSSSYIRDDGWRPGGRVKQYKGGHDETWGGVRINIDSNYLDLGKGSVAPKENHCKGTKIDFGTYRALALKDADGPAVEALQCLLSERGVYEGRVDGRTRPATLEAARKWQGSRGFSPSSTFNANHWVSLLAQGPRAVLKVGSAGSAVRRVQRALDAAGSGPRHTGVYTTATRDAVRSYQQRNGLQVTGIVSNQTWKTLAKGRR